MMEKVKAYWYVVATCMIISLVTVTVYDRTLRHVVQPPAYTVINLSAIAEAKEKEFTAMFAKPNVTDKDREAAYDEVKKFGADMETQIGKYQQECQCLIFVKGALVGGGMDITNEIKKRLGL